MHDPWTKAQAFWTDRDFWWVHECFEELWKNSHEPDKSVYQALLLAGVFFHHALNDNPAGARLCAQRATALLNVMESSVRGTDLSAFPSAFSTAVERFNEGTLTPESIPHFMPAP
ncbi:MAG: DUF309 domain-containing protein [Planctomycetota bacterium]|jgi:predicted metal-dependent hydrolase